jgi:hypothetical protein
VSGTGGGASITSLAVIEVLDKLFIERGEPTYIRSDNGPEFIAEAIKRWLETSGVKTLYIEAGALWENASALEAPRIGHGCREGRPSQR